MFAVYAEITLRSTKLLDSAIALYDAVLVPGTYDAFPFSSLAARSTFPPVSSIALSEPTS